MGTRTRPLTRQQTEAFIEVLNNAPESELPYAAAAAIALGTGARIGEVLSMRVKDLFAPDGTPLERVTRSVEKRRSDVRLTIPFPWERMGAAVIRWHQKKIIKGQEQIFIGRDRKTCYYHQQRLLRRAGLAATGTGFHGLRKTCLLRFYKAFASKYGEHNPSVWRKVQRLAGHTRIDNTLIYLDADRDGASDHEIRTAWQNDE